MKGKLQTRVQQLEALIAQSAREAKKEKDEGKRLSINEQIGLWEKELEAIKAEVRLGEWPWFEYSTKTATGSTVSFRFKPTDNESAVVNVGTTSVCDVEIDEYGEYLCTGTVLQEVTQRGMAGDERAESTNYVFDWDNGDDASELNENMNLLNSQGEKYKGNLDDFIIEIYENEFMKSPYSGEAKAITEKAGALGYGKKDTGGGCSAFKFTNPTEKYLLVTTEGMEAPYLDSQKVIVGVYNSDDKLLGIREYKNVNEWLQAAKSAASLLYAVAYDSTDTNVMKALDIPERNMNKATSLHLLNYHLAWRDANSLSEHLVNVREALEDFEDNKPSDEKVADKVYNDLRELLQMCDVYECDYVRIIERTTKGEE